MNELETNLDIIIRSVVDEKSAENAPKEISRIILGALKDGCIEIPAAISDEFDKSKTSTKLIKAQKDFITQWEKMSKEGFSSSEEDLESFINKYTEFKKLMGKEGKGRSKQNLALRDLGLNEVVKSYKNATKQLETEIAKITSNKTIKSNVATQKLTNKREQKRTLKVPKSVLPKGYGNGWIDLGRTNPYEAKKSELSSYASGMNRQFLQSQREARKWAKKSLVTDKYKSNKELEEEVKKRHETDKIKGTNKNILSPSEKASQLAEDIRKNILPNLLEKIQKETDDTEVGKLTEKFFDTLKTISNLNQDAGKSIFSDVKKDIGLTLSKLGFSTTGNIGGTSAEEGTDKTEISRDPKIVPILKGLLDDVAKKEDEIKQELLQLAQLEKENTKSSKTAKEINSIANRLINETRTNRLKQKQDSDTISKTIGKEVKATETQTQYDIIENTAERTADDAAGKTNKKIESSITQDVNTGFNTDAKADELISIMRDILSAIQIGKPSKTRSGKSPKKQSQESNLPVPFVKEDWFNKNQFGTDVYGNKIVLGGQERKTKAEKRMTKEDIKPTINFGLSEIQEQFKYTHVALKTAMANIDKDQLEYFKQYTEELQKQKQRGSGISKSEAVTDKKSIFSEVEKLLKNILPSYINAKKILEMNQQEQERLQAERISKFGLIRKEDGSGVSDKILAERAKSMFDWWKGRKENPFKNLEISEGITVDTNAITAALQKSIEKNMFKAQTGGWKNTFANVMTGGLASIIQPSLEKSKAQIDGLNQIMANTRNTVESLLQVIQAKETGLRGLEKRGEATIDSTGKFVSGSNEAKILAEQLEDAKAALRGVLADAAATDEVVNSTNGKVRSIIKRLGFASPQLRKNNVILQNLNAKLDKNGKALKYQTRMSEILAYTFKRIGHYIGQMYKRLLLSLNPINLMRKAINGVTSLIKKSFNDFASYDIKWQRTMNVVKYNLRTVLRPAMEWIAQKLVNIIGFFDIISMKIQEAFGKIPVSLFDQSAANAEKMREELEQAANVTAGFDELHDIGSDNSAANDLMGDIYTPQLSKKWEDLANRIGDLFAGLIKGDLGFADVAKEILKILGELLADIGKVIWDWFKKTKLGQWIIDHWKGLLATLLAIFLAWKLGPLVLKGIGKILSALTKLNGISFAGLLKRISFSWWCFSIHCICSRNCKIRIKMGSNG